jgi:hypothetical protein
LRVRDFGHVDRLREGTWTRCYWCASARSSKRARGRCSPGRAATQGHGAAAGLKSFTANFAQLRAYCGDTEVVADSSFIIEHQTPERPPVREGLYVFAD